MNVPNATVGWTPQDESRYKLLQALVDTLERDHLFEDNRPIDEDVVEKEAHSSRISHRIDLAFSTIFFVASYCLVGAKIGSFREALWLAFFFPFFVIPGVVAGTIVKALTGFRKRYRVLKQDADHVKRRLARRDQILRARCELDEMESRRTSARKELVRRVRTKTSSEHWKSLRGYELEEALETLFTTANFAVSRVGGRGDDGVDLILRLGVRRIVVQSKGWATAVGPVVIRELIGTRHIHRASEAWLVTVGGLSDSASTLARRHNIRILSSENLAEIARGQFGSILS